MKEVVLTIEEILKLTPYSEDSLYVDFMDLDGFEMLSQLGSGTAPETFKDLVDKQYVKDFCNDCRCRELHVLYYKERPFYIYQYIGRGRHENMAILDEKVHSEFIIDCITEHFKEPSDIKQMTPQETYTVYNYNSGFFSIENGILVSANKE